MCNGEKWKPQWGKMGTTRNLRFKMWKPQETTIHSQKKHDSETLAQVAIRFALMNPKVSTVLVGFSELTQINEAVSCVGHEPFTQTQLEQLENLYTTDFGLA